MGEVRPGLLCDGGGGRVGRVHLSAEGLELGDGQVRGAAHGRGRGARSRVGRDEGLRALGPERREKDVGGGVQVALRVAADELAVLGDGDVALDDTGAHGNGGLVGLRGVLREQQGRAAVLQGS